jgi:glycosyltransferase involved in cell wall biosynthesis
MADGLRLAIVSSYPPSHAALTEYARQIVPLLADKPGIAGVVVLADRLDSGVRDVAPSDPRIAIERCWSFGSSRAARDIRRALRRHRPDAVIFNIHFTTFGIHKVPAALGLCAPALARLAGYPVVVLLHNLIDTVDLRRLGLRVNGVNHRLVRIAGSLATRAVLRAHVVAVTLPQHVELLREQYGAGNVVLIPHGSWGTVDRVDTRGQEEGARPFRLLAFGRFGTYKRLEIVFAALERLRAAPGQGFELTIAGIDNPSAAGYLQSMRARHGHREGVTFRGYVPEDDVPGLFAWADAALMPYEATTGSSGVVHLAGAAGCPLVLPLVGELRELIEAEDFAGEYYTAGSAEDLAAAILRLRDDPVRRREMGARNRLAASGLPIEELVDWYLIHLDRVLAANRGWRRRLALRRPAAA